MELVFHTADGTSSRMTKKMTSGALSRYTLLTSPSVELVVLHLHEHLPDFVNRPCYAVVERVSLDLVCYPLDERDTPHVWSQECQYRYTHASHGVSRNAEYRLV